MPGVRARKDKNGKLRYYEGWYFDWQGKRQYFKGTSSEKQTRALAAKEEEHHRLIKLGHLPPPKKSDDPHSFREIANEYLAWGEAQGGRGGRPWSERHAHNRRTHLRYWEERLGLHTLHDLHGVLPRVEKALRGLKSDGKSGSTLQRYAEALCAFCDWCKQRRYLDHHPLEGLAPFDTTPSTKRRALPPKDIKKLLNACAPHRRLTYEVAFCTGLRANELHSLQRDHLDTLRGGLRLDAEWTKDRKPGFQPLPASLVERLKEFAESGEADELYRRAYAKASADPSGIPTKPLLYVPGHPARDLYIDLAAAEVPKLTTEGKVDFHACRVAYATLVDQAGATPKESQELARHSTPELTMERYIKARSERLRQVTEVVGEWVRADEECGSGVARLAAGAEGLDVTAIPPAAYGDGKVVAAEGLEPSTLGL